MDKVRCGERECSIGMRSPLPQRVGPVATPTRPLENAAEGMGTALLSVNGVPARQEESRKDSGWRSSGDDTEILTQCQ